MRSSILFRALTRFTLFLACISATLLSTVIGASAQTHLVAFLSEEQEEPIAPVKAVGYASLVLNKERTEVRYSVVVWGLSGTIEDGHFHAAKRGEIGEVVHRLSFNIKNASTGVWTMQDTSLPLRSSLVDSLLAGLLYVNIHTFINPNGEIRGQIFKPEAYFAVATGGQEVPATASQAFGLGAFVLDPNDNTMFYRGNVAGQTTPVIATHLHQAPVGQPGGIVKTLAFDSSKGIIQGLWGQSDSTQPMSSEMLSSLRQGGLYWNVHTSLNPNGEIRGQVLRDPVSPGDSAFYFIAVMSGPQEGDVGEPSSAVGTALLRLNRAKDTLLTFAVVHDLSGPIEDGHIHLGEAGSPPGDPVSHLENTSYGVSGVWTSTAGLNAEMIDNLWGSKLYVNIHSAKFPNGEIRGQIIPLSQMASAASSVTASATPSSKTLVAYPNPATDRVSVEVSGPGSIELLDVLGRVVLARTVKDESERHLSLPTAGLARGSYVLIVRGRTDVKRMNLVLR